MRNGRAARLCFAALGLSIFVLGCSQPKGSVSGKVLFQGSPLPGGAVSLVAATGKSYGGTISETGDYSVEGVPAGTYKVVVDNTMLEMQEKMTSLPAGPDGKKVDLPSAPKKVGRYVPIPKTWMKSESSSLSLTVVKGSQTKDIELR